MVQVKFRYADKLSGWKWREQQCVVEDVEDCIAIYGLDEDDCEYEILDVKDMNDRQQDDLERD